jgi:hypothetical protein
MVAWVVIDRRHPRQSSKPSAVRPFPFSFPLHGRLNIWTPRTFRRALPSSVPSSKFRIPQLLCLALYENCRGCVPTIPILERPHYGRSDVQTCRRFNVFPTYLLFFQTPAHSFAMRKMLSHLFSNVSALFAKNHPGWGEEARVSARLNWLSSIPSDKIPSLPKLCRRMDRANEESR